MDTNLLKYGFEVLGGALIGIALLGQFFMNSSIGVVKPFHSRKRKFAAYSVRVAAATISFAVLVLVMRAIRTAATFTMFDVVAVTSGLTVTLVIGWKELAKSSKKKNAGKLSKA
jgi:hypothetical protein